MSASWRGWARSSARTYRASRRIAAGARRPICSPSTSCPSASRPGSPIPRRSGRTCSSGSANHDGYVESRDTFRSPALTRTLPRWRITSRPCKGGGRLSLIAMCLQQGVRKLAGLIRSTQVLTLPQVELRLHLPPNVSTRPTCAIFLAEAQHQPQPAPACSPCQG